MAVNEQLDAFVKRGLEQRLDRARIEQALLQAGWPPDQIRQARVADPAAADLHPAFRSTIDPSTAEPYSYRAIDGSSYEMCATFEADNREDAYSPPFWKHAAGRKCSQLDAQRWLER
jgi:hypothetical protein